MESKVQSKIYSVELSFTDAPEIELEGRTFLAAGAVLVWRQKEDVPTVVLYGNRGVAHLSTYEWPDWVCQLVSEQAPR